jgi:hypothetical protein
LYRLREWVDKFRCDSSSETTQTTSDRSMGANAGKIAVTTARAVFLAPSGEPCQSLYGRVRELAEMEEFFGSDGFQRHTFALCGLGRLMHAIHHLIPS